MVGVSTRASGGPAGRRTSDPRPRAAQLPAEPVGPVRFAGLLSSGARFALLLVAAALVAALVGAGISQPPAVAGIEESPAAVRLGIPLFRTLVDLGAVTVAGLGAAVPDARLRPAGANRAGDAPRPPDRRLGVAGLGCRPPSSRSCCWPGRSAAHSRGPAQLWAYLSNIPAGKGLLLSGVCGLASFWLARLSVRHGEKVPAELRVGVALFGLLPAAAHRARVQLVLARPGHGLDGAARGRGHGVGRRAGRGGDLPGRPAGPAGGGAAPVLQAGHLVRVHRRR